MRPNIHFTPEKGWMNDPNGLIYIDGVYHLFYQYYPDNTKWGPMHWGHAVSDDLIKWKWLPIALFPTDEEYIFSGSAILDSNNVSGLGDGSQAPMLLFYTGHNPNTLEQMQCIAYSLDGVNFKRYDKNPVIPNYKGADGFKPDFRDPKVFANKVLGGYSMILAAGNALEFYHSDNLLNWEYTGEFRHGNYGYAGIAECPDCFPISSDDGIRWILSMSVIVKEADGSESNLMQYFVGDFDGKTFIQTDSFSDTQILDYGKDNYAMVSFAGCEKNIMLGWGENWADARVNTATDYFGKMTIAREVSLRKVSNLQAACDAKEDRYMLAQKPICAGFDKTLTIKEGEKVQVEGICIENLGDSIRIDKANIKRCISGDSAIRYILDEGYLEVFADDGLIVYSCNL